jgi:PAS domain S-box-containing protein
MSSRKNEVFEEQILELTHLYETAPVGLCLMDRELRYVRINERLAQINGKPVCEHIGRSLKEVIPELAPRLEPVHRRVLETGEPVLNIDIHGTTAADPDVERDWLCSYYPLIGEDGTVRGISAVVQEITERKQAQRALQEAHQELERRVEERTEKLKEANKRLTAEVTERRRTEAALETSQTRFRLLVERTHVIPWEADAETWQTRYVGPQASTILGYPKEKWYEKDFWVEHLHPEDRERVIAYITEQQETRETYDNEYRLLSASGDVVWVHDHVSVERRKGKPYILRGFMLDITDRKHAEEVLRESVAALRLGQEKIQHLAGELIRSQETERRHVALELHEDINQRLAALSIALNMLERELSGPPEAVREKLTVLQERTAALIDDVRQLSRQLHPAGIEHVGVASGLRSLCNDFSRKEDIAIQLVTPDSPEQVSFDVALCLYRVTEESLRNIQRHSGAKSARVTLAAKKDGLRLSISDDGVGFDIDKAQPAQGVGLLSMEERVRLLNGSFRIKSHLRTGTELEVFVPLGDRK